MSVDVAPNHEIRKVDDLALLVAKIEDHLSQGRYQEAATLFENNSTSAWFGFQPTRAVEILQLLITKTPAPRPILKSIVRLMTATSSGKFDSHQYVATIDSKDPQQMFLLSMFRMADLRFHGRAVEALEQSKQLETYLDQMQLSENDPIGLALQAAVETGITATLAGDFQHALASFTQAQLLPFIPKFPFLTRNALVQAALIHACVGNAGSAVSLLNRADQIPRTSSWVEKQIDVHRDFASILVSARSYEEALDRLETISLHDIGEMWPFYIMVIHRILEAVGLTDELDHRLEMFDSIPLPKIDGEGFSGSIIPIKRAMLAMRTGRSFEAQEFLARADSRLVYTRLLSAAVNIYSGRTQQAIQQATRLKAETRGFRLLEIRRLAILTSAYYQADNTEACLETLARAVSLPHGLARTEAELFSPEVRELATKHIAAWPPDAGGPSAFLTGLPKPGRALTEREIQIVGQLAKGHPRAKIAENLYISLNTLKSQLRSIYRKLEVSTASDAVVGAQRRGLI